MFPFYMLNFADKDLEKFEFDWQEGCAKLAELVKSGHFEKSDAEQLIVDSCTVIDKAKIPNEKKEVLKKMSMFDVVGVGPDWVEIKRQKDEAVRQSAIASAQEALSMGLTLEQAAKISNLTVDEVKELVKQSETA